MPRDKDHNRILREAHDLFSTLIDDADSNTTYIGKAVLGTATSSSVWQLRKLSTSGNVTTMSWPSSDDNFAYVWDNRTSYTYST